MIIVVIFTLAIIANKLIVWFSPAMTGTVSVASPVALNATKLGTKVAAKMTSLAGK